MTVPWSSPPSWSPHIQFGPRFTRSPLGHESSVYAVHDERVLVLALSRPLVCRPLMVSSPADALPLYAWWMLSASRACADRA